MTVTTAPATTLDSICGQILRSNSDAPGWVGLPKKLIARVASVDVVRETTKRQVSPVDDIEGQLGTARLGRTRHFSAQNERCIRCQRSGQQSHCNQRRVVYCSFPCSISVFWPRMIVVVLHLCRHGCKSRANKKRCCETAPKRQPAALGVSNSDTYEERCSRVAK